MKVILIHLLIISLAMMVIICSPVPSNNKFGDRVDTSSSSEEEETIIPYSFAFEVSDPETNNYQNRAEIKQTSGDVFGSYSVLMPDGLVYTTKYNATKGGGYIALLDITNPQL